jgi:hypothetical protein
MSSTDFPGPTPDPTGISGNVVPLRPRQPARGSQPASQPGTAQRNTPLPDGGGRLIRLTPARPASTSSAGTSSAGEPFTALHQPSPEPARPVAVQERGASRERGSASGHQQWLIVTARTAPAIVPEAETAPPEKETDMQAPSPSPRDTPSPGPVSARTFSWSRLLMIVVGAFLLGIAVSWGAIAIGANVLGVWPHGFPLYAMMIGGGFTMMLTAGLMTAVFYSDSSGHDESVHQFHPEKRRPPDID